MKFQKQVRNEHGKCDLPSNTIRRIRDGFAKLDLDIGYAPYRVSEHIHWGQIGVESLELLCEGKGITPELAAASAHAELCERFSAGLFYPAFEEQVRFNMPALYNEGTSRFLNFEWMPGYVSSHQDELEGRILRIEDLLVNERQLTEAEIAEIKSSQMARHWVDGYSITRQETVKVPVNFVAYIHASNGLAAGNTVEEALIQASCEIFERHSQIQIIKPERIVPTFDPDSVESDVLREMMQHYRRRNVDVLLKDLSLDGLLPCVGVLFTNHNLPADRLEHRILIPGVSFNLDEGLTRCFTESMQGRRTLRAPRPQLDRPVVPRSRVDNHYLLMKCCISLKDISFLEQGDTVPYRSSRIGDVLGEIEAIKAICSKLETECIVLDHTHPVLGFPVVRVIIPGISDFLPFLSSEILVAQETRPSSTWRGDQWSRVMQSFFD